VKPAKAWEVLTPDEIEAMPSELYYSKPWLHSGIGYATYMRAIGGKPIRVEAATLLRRWLQRQKETDRCLTKKVGRLR